MSKANFMIQVECQIIVCFSNVIRRNTHTQWKWWETEQTKSVSWESIYFVSFDDIFHRVLPCIQKGVILCLNKKICSLLHTEKKTKNSARINQYHKDIELQRLELLNKKGRTVFDEIFMWIEHVLIGLSHHWEYSHRHSFLVLIHGVNPSFDDRYHLSELLEMNNLFV